MVAPERATLAPALAAVTVPPAQVVAPLAAAVLTRFAGYVSVKAAPVTAVAFGLVSVMVRTDTSVVRIELGANAFATVSPPRTLSVAFAAVVLPPAFAVSTPPAASALL